MASEVLGLAIENDVVVGEVALEVAPGTTANVRDRALDSLLGAQLTEIASQRGVVLSAAPSAYAFQEPGKDSGGRTRFVVRGRVEGDRLLPARPR